MEIPLSWLRTVEKRLCHTRALRPWAEDAAAEAACRAFEAEANGTLRPRRDLQDWLCRVAYNWAVDRARRAAFGQVRLEHEPVVEPLDGLAAADLLECVRSHFRASDWQRLLADCDRTQGRQSARVKRLRATGRELLEAVA